MGPHDRRDGSHSLCIDVGHLENLWGTRHRDSSYSDGVGLLDDQGNPDPELCMQGPRGCGHLDNCGNHHRDVHLSCLSCPGSSPSCSRLESIGNHVAYQGAGLLVQAPSWAGLLLRFLVYLDVA